MNRALVLVVVVVALAFTGGARADDVLLQQTLAVSLGGQEVGTIEALDKRTPDGIELSRVAKLRVHRGDTVNDMTTVTLVKLKPDLSPVSYHYERTDAGGTLVTDGRVDGKQLLLTSAQNGATVKNTLPVPEGTTFSLAIEHEVRSGLKDGMSFDKPAVIEEMGAPVTMHVEVKQKDAGYLVSSTFMNLKTEETMDAKGRTVVSRTPSMGIVAYPPGHAPPDVGAGNADLLAVSTWITQPVRPPVSRVVYRITAPDARNFAVPEDERQKILQRTDSVIVVEVHAGDAFTGAISNERKAVLMSATPYEEIDDPRIRRAADNAAAGAETRRDEVKQLVDFVFGYVKEKGLDKGYAPAVATLESRSGDCTEHSVLLSALLRARKFPTRLVDGVIVDGTRAGYHEWVEVYLDGEGFVPADPTFGQFPAGPERLKLAVGSTIPDEHLQLSLAAARLLKSGVKIEVLESSR